MGELICVGIIGSAVVAVAFTEKRLETKGMYLESDMINSLITLILTLGGICSTVWFLFKMVGRFVLNV